MRNFRSAIIAGVMLMMPLPGSDAAMAQQIERPRDLDDPRVMDALDFCKTEVTNLHVGMSTLPDRNNSYTEQKYLDLLSGNFHFLVNAANPLSAYERNQATDYRDGLIRGMARFQPNIDEVLRNNGNPYSWQVGQLADSLRICTYNFYLEERYLAGANRMKAKHGVRSRR